MSVVKLWGVPMAVAPWVVSDELWERIEPLLPKVKRRSRYPGRKRLGDREALQGILFVLHTGMAWQHLPLELGFGSGSTCYRRLDEWQQAGVWERLHQLLLAELRAAGKSTSGSSSTPRPARPHRPRRRAVQRSTSAHQHPCCASPETRKQHISLDIRATTSERQRVPAARPLWVW